MGFLGKIFNKYVFPTTSGSGTTFDPLLTQGGQRDVQWWHGTENKSQTDSASFTFADATLKNVVLAIDDPEDITLIAMSADSVEGALDIADWINCLSFDFSTNAIDSIVLPITAAIVTKAYFYSNSELITLDLSGFTNLKDRVRSYNCPELTTLTMPTSPQYMIELSGHTCPKLTSVDLSGFSLMNNCNIYYYGNTLMTSFTPPGAGSGAITNLWIYSSGLSGTVDLSSTNTLGGSVRMSNNTAVTSFLFTTCLLISNLEIQNCNITGTLDLSPLTLGFTTINLDTNALMTAVTVPTTAVACSRFRAYSCGLTGTLDLSPMSNLGGDIYLYGNPAGLTTITNPASSSTPLEDYHAYSLTGLTAIDLSGFAASSSTNIKMYGCAAMTTFLPPTGATKGTLLWIQSSNITGTLNLSGWSGLATDISLDTNSLMTAVTLPTSSSAITTLRLQDCDITGNLDLSSLTNLGGTVRVFGNANMTSVTNPTGSSTNLSTYDNYANTGLNGTEDLSGYVASSGANIKIYSNTSLTGFVPPTGSNKGANLWIQGNDLTGTIDLSGWSGLATMVLMEVNPNITAITLPTSSTATTYLRGSGVAITTLDLSPMTGLSGSVIFRDCTSLTSITWPSGNTGFSLLDFDGCALGVLDLSAMGTNNGVTIDIDANGMSAAELNETLVNLDTDGWTGGVLTAAGSNAAPDGSSGGFDGTTAKANLVTSGWTVTTN